MIRQEFNVYPGSPTPIILSQKGLNVEWKILDDNTLHHTNTIQSAIGNEMGELELNTVYEFTYEVFDHESCRVWMTSGARLGTSHSSNGIYSEVFTIESEEDKLISFVANGVTKVRNLKFRKRGFDLAPIDYDDPTLFENKSWTISYDLKNRSWIGWHSYIPDYYINTPNNLYSYWSKASTNGFYKHHQGLFGNFYGKQYSHIIEIISVKPLVNTVWEDVTLQISVKKYDDVLKQYVAVHDKIFDKVIMYNSRQCTGVLDLKVKSDDNDYLMNQVDQAAGEEIVNNVEGNWRLNDIRDHVIDYTKPLFRRDWNSTQSEYPIDKVINNSIIDYLKDWYELESFRDKYLAVRLIYSNFANDNEYQLTTNYSIISEENSIR